jgi:aminomethyltransferase
VSRTGYTGEDGYELILGANAVVGVWQSILDAGASKGVKACGLGSRDTLRLEAAMPLYGHELSESINPYEAGLGFAVNLEGRMFPGHDLLVPQKGNTSLPRRVGLSLDGKRVPREGYPVVSGGKPVGHVTSGTFSPTLNRPIAMAYVEPSAAEIGTKLAVDVRGREEPCTVVALPFYKREH